MSSSPAPEKAKLPRGEFSTRGVSRRDLRRWLMLFGAVTLGYAVGLYFLVASAHWNVIALGTSLVSLVCLVGVLLSGLWQFARYSAPSPPAKHFKGLPESR
jgi:hypothetical protein